jgi:hypothetical protein
MTPRLLPVDLALRHPESAQAFALLADHGPVDAERLLRWTLVPPQRLAQMRDQGFPTRLVRLAADALVHQRLEIVDVAWNPRTRRPAYLCDLLYGIGDGRVQPEQALATWSLAALCRRLADDPRAPALLADLSPAPSLPLPAAAAPAIFLPRAGTRALLPAHVPDLGTARPTLPPPPPLPDPNALPALLACATRRLRHPRISAARRMAIILEVEHLLDVVGPFLPRALVRDSRVLTYLAQVRALSAPLPRPRRPRCRSGDPLPALMALADALPEGLHLHAHAGSALLALEGLAAAHPPLAIQAENLHTLADHLAHLHRVLPPLGTAEAALASLPPFLRRLRAGPNLPLPGASWAAVPGLSAHLGIDGKPRFHGAVRASWPDPLPQRPLPSPAAAHLLDTLGTDEISLPPRVPLSSHHRLRMGLRADAVAALQAAAPGLEGRIRLCPIPGAVLLLLPGVGRGGPDLLLLPRPERPPCAAASFSPPPPSS